MPESETEQTLATGLFLVCSKCAGARPAKVDIHAWTKLHALLIPDQGLAIICARCRAPVTGLRVDPGHPLWTMAAAELQPKN